MRSVNDWEWFMREAFGIYGRGKHADKGIDMGTGGYTIAWRINGTPKEVSVCI